MYRSDEAIVVASHYVPVLCIYVSISTGTYEPSPGARPLSSHVMSDHMLSDYARPTGAFSKTRTEWVVFHEEMRIGGSIDFVYRDDHDGLHLVDWKRSSNLQDKLDNIWQAPHSVHTAVFGERPLRADTRKSLVSIVQSVGVIMLCFTAPARALLRS